jgi:hypothetical protein
VEVTDHHTAVDYANVLKELSDAAKKIVLVPLRGRGRRYTARLANACSDCPITGPP